MRVCLIPPDREQKTLLTMTLYADSTAATEMEPYHQTGCTNSNLNPIAKPGAALTLTLTLSLTLNPNTNPRLP